MRRKLAEKVLGWELSGGDFFKDRHPTGFTWDTFHPDKDFTQCVMLFGSRFVSMQIRDQGDHYCATVLRGSIHYEACDKVPAAAMCKAILKCYGISVMSPSLGDLISNDDSNNRPSV